MKTLGDLTRHVINNIDKQRQSVPHSGIKLVFSRYMPCGDSLSDIINEELMYFHVNANRQTDGTIDILSLKVFNDDDEPIDILDEARDEVAKFIYHKENP
jgi:hypothetical protein